MARTKVVFHTILNISQSLLLLRDDVVVVVVLLLLLLLLLEVRRLSRRSRAKMADEKVMRLPRCETVPSPGSMMSMKNQLPMKLFCLLKTATL